MRNLDFFRQPRSGSVKSTAYGGIISLFSLLMLLILIFQQIRNYTKSTVDVEVRVENSPMASNIATLELNMTVYDCACTFINPMITSGVEASVNSIDDAFIETRIFNNGSGTVWQPQKSLTEELDQIEDEKTMTEALKAKLVKGESCNLYASIPILKVEGVIAISTMVNPAVMILAKQLGHSVEIKNHQFHSLRFKNGATSLFAEDDADYSAGFEDEIESFDRIKSIKSDLYMGSDKGRHIM